MGCPGTRGGSQSVARKKPGRGGWKAAGRRCWEARRLDCMNEQAVMQAGIVLGCLPCRSQQHSEKDQPQPPLNPSVFTCTPNLMSIWVYERGTFGRDKNRRAVPFERSAAFILASGGRIVSAAPRCLQGW